MSQTLTCQIELDELPALERGYPTKEPRVFGVQTPDVLTENERYFTGGNTLGSNEEASLPTHAETNSATVAESVGFRIGNIFIEDKVLYLLGVSVSLFSI